MEELDLHPVLSRSHRNKDRNFPAKFVSKDRHTDVGGGRNSLFPSLFKVPALLRVLEVQFDASEQAAAEG